LFREGEVSSAERAAFSSLSWSQQGNKFWVILKRVICLKSKINRAQSQVVVIELFLSKQLV